MTALDILRFMAITQNKCLLWSSFNEISVYFVNCIDHPLSDISPLDYGYDLSHKKSHSIVHQEIHNKGYIICSNDFYDKR
jgi:hypothetical protein